MNPIEIVSYNPEAVNYTDALTPFNEVHKKIMKRCEKTFAFLEAARFLQIFLDQSFKNLHSFFPIDSRATQLSSPNTIDPEHYAKALIQAKQIEISKIIQNYASGILSFLAYLENQEKETQEQLSEFNKGLTEWETVIKRHDVNNRLKTLGQNSADTFEAFKSDIQKFREDHQTLEKTHNLIIERSRDINRHITATNTHVSSWNTAGSLLGDHATTELPKEGIQQNFYPGTTLGSIPKIGKCAKHRENLAYLNDAEPLFTWYNDHFRNTVTTICDLFTRRGIFQFEQLLKTDSSSLVRERFTKEHSTQLEQLTKIIESYTTVIETLTEQLKKPENPPINGFSVVFHKHNNGEQSKRNVLNSLIMNRTFIESLHQAIEIQGKKVLAEMNPPSTETTSTNVVFSLLSYLNPFKGSSAASAEEQRTAV